MIATRLEKVVSSRFFQVWTDLITKGLRPGDATVSIRGKVAHRASNDAVRHFLASECDTLLMLDSDADVEPDFLTIFRDYEPGWEYDVLQAFYTRRGWPPRAIWMKRNPLGDVMETFITNPDTIDDVAIAGTHAVLIRRRVFEQLLGDNDPETYDWFYYPRNDEASEDGMFSQDAIAAGFRVGATTHAKAGHICEITTNWDTYIQYLGVTGRIPLIERYGKLAELVGRFTGESPELVVAKAIKGCENTRGPWQQARTNGPASVRAFYGQPDNGYLYDLCNWNCQPGYERLIAPLREINGRRVLVIGAGLGTECEYLLDRNQVDAFELPGVLRDFLRFRFGERLNILEADRLEEVTGQYDLIVAIDVIEHIHPAEIDSALAHLDKLLGAVGQLYYHNNFGEQNKFPMHYDHGQKFARWEQRRNAIEMFAAIPEPGESLPARAGD